MLTRDDKVRLGRLTERDEAGRHFTVQEPMDWLLRMEAAGYIRIERTVHEATGMQYAPEYWHLEVAPEVGDWFDVHGNLIDPA